MNNIQTKAYEPTDFTVDPDKREFICIISTGDLDRDNEVVDPKGLVKEDFTGLPIYLNHNYISDDKALPIGTTRWLKATQYNGKDVIIAKGYCSDKSKESRDAFGLIQDGVLNRISVGFVSDEKSPPTQKEISLRPELKSAKNIIRKWRLHEWSVVGIPANKEARILAVSKGYSQKIIDKVFGDEVIKSQNFNDLVKVLKGKYDPALVDKICNPQVVMPKENQDKQKDLEELLAKQIEAIANNLDVKAFSDKLSAKLK